MDLSRIKDLANRLRLTNLARSLSEIKGTEKEWRFLEKVLRTEQEIRDGNKEQVLIKRAKFPVIKTMEEFELDAQEKLTKWHLTKLSETKWIEEKYNVLLIGSAGTGKTHLAVAIGLKAIGNNKKVVYTTVNELLFLIKTQQEIKKSKIKLDYIEDCDVVIIDELGYTPLSREETLTLYKKIDALNKRKSLILATNRTFEGWGDIFYDEQTAETLLDRVVENCQVITLTGGSYRLRTHKGIFDVN